MRQGPEVFGCGPAIGGRGTHIRDVSHFNQIVGITADAFYDCSTVGLMLNDQVGTQHLTQAGGVAAHLPVGGKLGHHYHSAGFGYNRPSSNSPGMDSCIIGAVATFPYPIVGQAGVIGVSSSTAAPNFSIYRAANNVNYPAFLIRDTVPVGLFLTDTNINVVTPNGPVLLLGQIDRSTNTGRFLVARPNQILTQQSGSTAAIGSISGGTEAFVIGAGRAMGAGNGVQYGFFMRGAKTQGNILPTIAKRLGFGGI